MNTIARKARFVTCCIWLCCLGIAFLSGCTKGQAPEAPPSGGQLYGTPPTLSSLTISPNPTSAGNIVHLSTTYIDPDADLHRGFAAISVNGENLSRIDFRATDQFGTLTLPFTVSHYIRPSDVNISLKIQDTQGNWSNAVSAVLSVR